MYLYETHLHTAPASRCATASVRASLEFYKRLGYAGVCITNHFLDGNIGGDRTRPYEEQLRFYFADAEEGIRIGRALGLTVLTGVEMSYKGTDFLVYGLGHAWFLAHPEIMEMKRSDQLRLLADEGALIVHAHPFREAGYIDHIRLFPRSVHAVEIYNACRSPFENRLAERYAEDYGLLPFAGSDNHNAGASMGALGGMCSEEPLTDEADLVRHVKEGRMHPFRLACDSRELELLCPR